MRHTTPGGLAASHPPEPVPTPLQQLSSPTCIGCVTLPFLTPPAQAYPPFGPSNPTNPRLAQHWMAAAASVAGRPYPLIKNNESASGTPRGFPQLATEEKGKERGKQTDDWEERNLSPSILSVEPQSNCTEFTASQDSDGDVSLLLQRWKEDICIPSSPEQSADSESVYDNLIIGDGGSLVGNTEGASGMTLPTKPSVYSSTNGLDVIGVNAQDKKNRDRAGRILGVVADRLKATAEAICATDWVEPNYDHDVKICYPKEYDECNHPYDKVLQLVSLLPRSVHVLLVD